MSKIIQYLNAIADTIFSCRILYLLIINVYLPKEQMCTTYYSWKPLRIYILIFGCRVFSAVSTPVYIYSLRQHMLMWQSLDPCEQIQSTQLLTHYHKILNNKIYISYVPTQHTPNQQVFNATIYTHVQLILHLCILQAYSSLIVLLVTFPTLRPAYNIEKFRPGRRSPKY